jgi:hypothetical protein
MVKSLQLVLRGEPLRLWPGDDQGLFAGRQKEGPVGTPVLKNTKVDEQALALPPDTASGHTSPLCKPATLSGLLALAGAVPIRAFEDMVVCGCDQQALETR